MDARLTIIVPTYNRLNLLKKCLDTISNQTDKNFEFIIGHNCSNDGTIEYLMHKYSNSNAAVVFNEKI